MKGLHSAKTFSWTQYSLQSKSKFNHRYSLLHLLLWIFLCCKSLLQRLIFLVHNAPNFAQLKQPRLTDVCDSQDVLGWNLINLNKWLGWCCWPIATPMSDDKISQARFFHFTSSHFWTMEVFAQLLTFFLAVWLLYVHLIESSLTVVSDLLYTSNRFKQYELWKRLLLFIWQRLHVAGWFRSLDSKCDVSHYFFLFSIRFL